MKRKWFWLLVLVIPVIIGAGYVLVPVKESRISQANCAKIQKGWSEEQVGELLGRPVFSVTDSSGPIMLDEAGRILTATTWSMWRDEDDNGIQINFDYRGVTDKTFEASDLSFWARLKRRIERRIRALWR